MPSVTIGGTKYPMADLTDGERSFYGNFLRRQLVFGYGVPLGEITADMVAHVARDLACVRYLAWLRLRKAGVTLDMAGELVTDANAPDAFAALMVESPPKQPSQPITGTAEEQLAEINRRREAAGREPMTLKPKQEPQPAEEAPADAV